MTARNLVTAPIGTTLAEAEDDPAPQQDREAAGRRRRRPAQGPDHRQGHPEEDPVPATRRRTSRDDCVSARRSGVGPDALERAEALVDAGVDVLVVDTAHGHSHRRPRGRAADQGAPLRRDRRGERRDRRGARGADRRGRRCGEGRRRAGLDLHDARRGGRRRAADHGDLRLRARGGRSTACR